MVLDQDALPKVTLCGKYSKLILGYPVSAKLLLTNYHHIHIVWLDTDKII